MPNASPTVPSDLVDLVAHGRVLALTGAGISTDSGIPDYRRPDGRARHADPMTYERFLRGDDERRRYWARSHLGWPRVAAARPNGAHHALVELERAGLLAGLVTQNVDGLHRAAGSRDVIELHGRLDTVVCLGCDTRRPRVEVGLRLDAVNPGFRARWTTDPTTVRPDGDVRLAEDAVCSFRTVTCRTCDGVLKPDVVFFGEHVPRGRFRAALGRLETAASLLVLGSSLMVGSGYRMVTAARRRGLPVAVVTRGVTRADHLVDLRVDASLTPLLRSLAAEVAPRVPQGDADGSAPTAT